MVKRKRIKRQTMIYKILLRKQNIEQHEPHEMPRVNSGAPEGLAISVSVSRPNTH